MTLEAIESEVQKLSFKELAEFRRWFMSFDPDAWDAEIERDAASGKLDTLANEALVECRSGMAKEI